MDQPQAYTESVPWLDYTDVRAKLEADYAEHTPDERLPIFNRALRDLTTTKFAAR